MLLGWGTGGARLGAALAQVQRSHRLPPPAAAVHTAGAFLQLLFVPLPSLLVADFIFAPREIPLQAGLEHFCGKDGFMVHSF